MIIQPLKDIDLTRRQKIMSKVDGLKKAGICPTCKNFKTGGIYPSIGDQVFYEDDLVICFLETYPRNPGHTIVLVKPHYEDISELPVLIATKVFKTIHAAINTLKSVLGAEKLYLCTMCDGPKNHLHFQLIPRLTGDNIQGSYLFVKDRGVLKEYGDVVKQLKVKMVQQ